MPTSAPRRTALAAAAQAHTAARARVFGTFVVFGPLGPNPQSASAAPMDPSPPLPADPLLDLPAPLRTLASRGVPHRYRKGTLLIQEGEHGDTLFIILTGRVH